MEDHAYVPIRLDDDVELKPSIKGRVLNPSQQWFWIQDDETYDYMIQPSTGLTGMWYWEINPEVHRGSSRGWGNSLSLQAANDIAIFVHQKFMEEKNG